MCVVSSGVEVLVTLSVHSLDDCCMGRGGRIERCMTSWCMRGMYVPHMEKVLECVGPCVLSLYVQ